MRIGFILSLLLTIPVVLYSSLGQKILGVNLPAPLPVSLAFPDGGVNLLSLLLASLVVFWPGWIFISGAYYALKKKGLWIWPCLSPPACWRLIFTVLR